MDTTELDHVEDAKEEKKPQSAEEPAGAILTEEQIDGMGRVPLIKHLEASQNCILSLNRLYNEYEGLRAKIKAIEEQKSSIIFGKLYMLLAGYGLTVCAVFFTLIESFPMGNQKYHFSDTLVGLVFVALAVLFTKWVKQKHGTEEERKAKAEAYYNSAYPPVAQRMGQINEEVKALTETPAYKNTLILIPPDYMDLNSISAIIHILQNRRANGITEALNVYENALHQQRLEHAANRGADAQERAASAAERTASAAERTANATEVQTAYAAQISQNTRSAAKSAKELNAFVKRMM